MRVFLWAALGFVLGAVAGYAAPMFGYSVYIDLFKVHDQDGGGAMAMGLIIGPAVGLFCGLVTAILFALRAAFRRERG